MKPTDPRLIHVAVSTVLVVTGVLKGLRQSIPKTCETAGRILDCCGIPLLGGDDDDAAEYLDDDSDDEEED